MTIVNFEALRTASMDDLRNANRLLLDQMRQLQQISAMEKMREFRVGDIAEFDTNKRVGGIARIKITKFNNKTVSGSEIDRLTGRQTNATWRVAASLLRPVSA